MGLHGQAVKTSPFHGGNTGSIPVGVICADMAQLAEQLICNQQVIGSSPIIGFMGGFPSGQRGQTVNLLAFAFEGSNPSLPTTFHFMARSFRERVFLFPHPHDTGKGKRKRGSPSRMHKVFFLPDAGGETVL